METSLNMNNLARSLPSSALVKAEQETMDTFKAAAQAITLLYRSSTKASKRHFDAGYAAALDDLLHVIQHGLSAGPDINISGAHVQSEHEGVEEGMTIGRVMDWIEARQEGLRVATALGEEEEEDDRERGAVPRAEPSNNSSHHKNTRELEGKRISRSTQPTHSESPPPPSAAVDTGYSTSDQEPPKSLKPTRSRSPPASSPITSATATTTPAHCHPPSTGTTSIGSRQQPRTRHRTSTQTQPLHTSFATNVNPSPHTHANSAVPPLPHLNSSVLGAKRRHAAMLLDAYPPPAVALSPSDLALADFPSPTISSDRDRDNTLQFTLGPNLNTPSSNGRKRMRSLRSNNINNNSNNASAVRSEIGMGTGMGVGYGFGPGGEQGNGNLGHASENLSLDSVMDVEDEGRERKRLARR